MGPLLLTIRGSSFMFCWLERCGWWSSGMTTYVTASGSGTTIREDSLEMQVITHPMQDCPNLLRGQRMLQFLSDQSPLVA